MCGGDVSLQAHFGIPFSIQPLLWDQSAIQPLLPSFLLLSFQLPFGIGPSPPSGTILL